jgi:hypothetical protein
MRSNRNGTEPSRSWAPMPRIWQGREPDDVVCEFTGEIAAVANNRPYRKRAVQRFGERLNIAVRR